MIAIWLFLIGAALGSFSLVLAWRLHDKQNWVSGRSKCDNCAHVLEVRDLIPILSWLALRGKCRFCKKKLPLELLFAELLMGALVVLSYALWPLQANTNIFIGSFAVWLVLLTLFSALFWYDMRWYILPTSLVRTASLPVIVIVVLQAIEGESVMIAINAAITAGVLFLFLWTLHTYSKGKWIGYGDVRLSLPIGLLTGTLLSAWLMLFIASILGILFALPSIFRKQRSLSSKIPFGPMLLLATIIVFLSSEFIIEWYRLFSGL